MWQRIVRALRVRQWRKRGHFFYLCHLAHENDRVSARTSVDIFKWAGVELRLLEIGESGQRPELQKCLDADPVAVIGHNSQLDHSWIGDENFLDAAAKKNIPVIQIIMDHPSLRWPEFDNRPDAPNARYVFVSDFCERYFKRYGRRTARTGVINTSFSPLSRVERVSRESFVARDIPCLIPLNLRRLLGTQPEVEVRIAGLEPDLRETVGEAIEQARFDLDNPREIYLEAELARRGREISHSLMHVCAGLVEDMTQIWRRRRVFEVARRFPVLIQTDLPPPEFVDGAKATFRSTAEWTNPKATLARLKQCRAGLSVSMTNDCLHDRTGSAINAGCVAIVEDNVAHRRLLRHGRSALFFRYDDDSLEQCLDLVCSDPGRAYPIARAGMKVRDRPAVRYAGCHNLIDLAID